MNENKLTKFEKIKDFFDWTKHSEWTEHSTKKERIELFWLLIGIAIIVSIVAYGFFLQ